MRLTRAKVMDIASDLSATRNMELAKLAEGESGATQMTLVFITAVRHVATTRDICLDVTKEMFDDASIEVTAESTEGENNSLIYTLDTMVFLCTVSTELYGKGENNETEKADS